MKKSLSLKAESLAELTGDDLATVAGGNKPLTDGCPTPACPTNGYGFCSFDCQWTFNGC